jgi:hypothetical protein
MEAQQRESCIERPELDGAQQEGKVVRARPQLGGHEDHVAAVVDVAVPAGPQSLVEIFGPCPTGEFEHERLDELVRWHAASIAAPVRAPPDALGSIFGLAPFEGEPHPRPDERDAGQAVECGLAAAIFGLSRLLASPWRKALPPATTMTVSCEPSSARTPR